MLKIDAGELELTGRGGFIPGPIKAALDRGPEAELSQRLGYEKGALEASQHNPGAVLIRLNQIMRGWASYFKHAVSKHTSIRCRTPCGGGRFGGYGHCTAGSGGPPQTVHHLDGRWKPLTADGTELVQLASGSPFGQPAGT